MVINPRATPALVVIHPGYFGPEPIETFSEFYQQLLFCCGVSQLPKSNNRVTLQEFKIKTTRIGGQRLQELEVKDYKICKKSFVGPILWSQLVGCEPILWLQQLQSDLLCGLNLLEICEAVLLFCWIHRFKGDLKFHPF